MDPLKKLTCVAISILWIITVTEAKPGYHGPYVVNRWYLMQGFSDTPFSECGGSASIKKVEVIPCDSDETCDLKTGSNTTFNIDFIPKSDSTTLSAIVHGIVAGVPMPFHFPQADACKNSNITCPIKTGQIYSYSVQLPVLKSYPKIKVIVKWELKDQSGGDVVCVEIPARLV